MQSQTRRTLCSNTHTQKATCVYKKTANPRNTLPHSAARLRPALGTKTPDAAPPWFVELAAPVEPASPKPELDLGGAAGSCRGGGEGGDGGVAAVRGLGATGVVGTITVNY
jgi:hypothetical protein